MSAGIVKHGQKVLNKLIIIVGVAVVIVTVLIGLSAFSHLHAASLPPTPEQYFTFDSSTGTITQYDGVNGPKDIVIPATIGGVTVLHIEGITDGSQLFPPFSDQGITSVVFPETVETIGMGAFNNNNITSLIIPDSVTYISSGAFIGDPLVELRIGTKSYVGMPHLDLSYNFNHIPSLNTVIIGNSVNSISDSFEMVPITSLDLGESIQTITNGSFNDTMITDLYIPNSVATLNYGSLSNNTELRHIVFGNAEYQGPAKIVLGTGGFSNLPKLESLKILSNVREIGGMGFSSMPALSYVEIGKGTENITDGALSSNPVLETIKIGDDMKIIDQGAFEQTPSLVNLDLGNSIEVISQSAFSENKLVTLTLPASLKELSYGAFDSSSELRTLTINGDTDVISSFGGIPKLTEIFIHGNATIDDWTKQTLTDTVANTGEYIRIYATKTSGWWNAPDLSGIYIVNPARVTVRYIGIDGNDLAPAISGVGGGLIDFTVTSNLEGDFSLYYRIGNTVTYEPPVVMGYITPKTEGFVLGDQTNIFTYTYYKPAYESLANTGSPWVAIVSAATAAVLLSTSVFVAMIRR